MLRIAVVGGTGLVGRHTVAAAERAGHVVVVVARSLGVDVLTGEGLDRALAGVDAVIDVTNLQGADAEQTRELFSAATRNVLAAQERAGVRHLVDMARRTLATRGESIRLVPSWQTGIFGVEAAGEMLLAGSDARLAPTTFDSWLEREAATTA